MFAGTIGIFSAVGSDDWDASRVRAYIVYITDCRDCLIVKVAG